MACIACKVSLASDKGFQSVPHIDNGIVQYLNVIIRFKIRIILFKLGQVDRVGSPENGTSVADWTDEEKAHEISIWSKPFDGVYTAASGKVRRLVMIVPPSGCRVARLGRRSWLAAVVADADFPSAFRPS